MRSQIASRTKASTWSSLFASSAWWSEGRSCFEQQGAQNRWQAGRGGVCGGCKEVDGQRLCLMPLIKSRDNTPNPNNNYMQMRIFVGYYQQLTQQVIIRYQEVCGDKPKVKSKRGSQKSRRFQIVEHAALSFSKPASKSYRGASSTSPSSLFTQILLLVPAPLDCCCCWAVAG